jgi:hypothetical protein
MLQSEDLLLGGTLTYDVEVPAHVLNPDADADALGGTIRLRPLTLGDLQLIARAAKENDSLMATLMVQRSLVEPEMTVPQVAMLHVGLLQYLLQQVNRISGITANPEQIAAITEDPLTKAVFILAHEFGWTPQEVSELTLGQILVHLQLLKERRIGYAQP